MTDVPDWLQTTIPAAARRPGLAIARLGDSGMLNRGGFALTSPAFDAQEELDPCFTALEEDAVAPPLEWTAPPPGSQELVVIVEDATAGDGGGDGDGAKEPPCHWLVWGLSGQRGKLLEGETPPRVGKNALGNSEWLLPHPPEGETRHYLFQIFATELPLTLMPGATREELIGSIEGYVTGCAVLHASFTGLPADEALDGDDSGRAEHD